MHIYGSQRHRILAASRNEIDLLKIRISALTREAVRKRNCPVGGLAPLPASVRGSEQSAVLKNNVCKE